MLRRVWTVLRARVSAAPRGGVPIAAGLAHAVVAAFLCGLVRDDLPPFAYGLFSLSLVAALLAIPLLGELGWLLRRDEAADWISAQPVRGFELKLARTSHLLLLLFALAASALVPAALLAPEETELAGRLALPFLGLGLATLLAALLLLVQSLLGERLEGLLVLFQTALVIGVICGVVVGMGNIPYLARTPTIGDEGAAFLWLYPPAWFAAPLATAEGEPARAWLPVAVTAAAAAALLLAPSPAAPRVSLGRPWLAFLLAPLRALATRFWVRRDERAAFDLVYDALPREREVVLRTVPMLAIPLAFLVVATGSSETVPGGRTDDLLALLLFTPGVYLPILLSHVPATATPRAGWILATAPISAGAVQGGAVKALALRFVVPLYGALAFIAWVQTDGSSALRLAVPGFLTSLLVLRGLYASCVPAPPLSTPPDELRLEPDTLWMLLALAVGLTLVAVLFDRFFRGPGATLLAAGLLLGADALLAARGRRGGG